MDIIEFEKKLQILKDDDIYLSRDAIREIIAELLEFIFKDISNSKKIIDNNILKEEDTETQVTGSDFE